MTDNLKKFLEAASKDAELGEKISKAETIEAIIAYASEKGFTLTEEDLKQPQPMNRLSDDELESVAGGKDCMCLVGGGGEADFDRETCMCVFVGTGEAANKTRRCFCFQVGTGDDC